MSDFTISVTGVDAAVADLRHLAADVQTGAAAVASGTATRVRSLVVSEVPRESGNLAASVTTLVVEGGRSVAYDTTRAPYAGWIDFGGKGRPYEPAGRYLFPAGMSAENQYGTALEADATRQIGKQSWSTH